MKILLTTLNAKYIHLNLAIRLLYSRHQDYDGLAWKEFTIKEKPEEIARACKDYEIVAFSCYIWNITQTLAVAQELKRVNPQIKILLGGPEVSYEYEDLILKDEVDFIITGEGEIPFELFLKQYPHIEGIPNLVSKKDGQMDYLPQQVQFELVQYSGINPYVYDDPKELYNKVCYIETSRGCPYKCEFCLASLDNKVRYLPMDDIKANLLYVMQHGRTIKFLDRTFNVKKDFTIEIFNFILQHRKPDQVFQFEITADIVHPDIVKYIQENVPQGVFRFEIGIQTVNQQANLQVSRKQNFDKTSKVIKQLDSKIEMHLDLIVGLPLDTWEDIKYSIESVFALHPPELQLGFLKFLKGTPMRNKQTQHGYVYDPNPPYQIIESNYLSKNELHEITLLEEALEIYWNKKRAVNALKYVGSTYGIFNFLQGLGNHFADKANFHQHTLFDVYDILCAYAKSTYPNDTILHELIAVDYYLQAKIKPQERYLNELDFETKKKWIASLKLQSQKYRYVMLPLSFDFNEWTQNNTLIASSSPLIVQYSGIETPTLINVELNLA